MREAIERIRYQLSKEIDPERKLFLYDIIEELERYIIMLKDDDILEKFD